MIITKQIKEYARDLVLELGGPVNVAKMITKETKKETSKQSIVNWYHVGIPLKHLQFICSKTKNYEPIDFRPDIYKSY